MPVSGANGIAWEFTAQQVEAINYLKQLYGNTTFTCDGVTYLNQIALAQTSAPFAEGQGIVAATLQDGGTLPPSQQCLNTPFQCIPERVGLAATTWGIFAERRQNIFID